MSGVHVGLAGLDGNVERYASKFDLVELRYEPGEAPKPKTLRTWRRAVSPAFTFSVVLPRVVSELAMTPAMDEALDEAIAVATAVEARAIILPTTSSVRPTKTNVERLRAVAARLPRPGVFLGWEPQGIWERAEILATAKLAGLSPVFDAARETLPGGHLVYTRIRSLGGAQALSGRTVEAVAEQLRGRREAFVVVEHRPSALRLKQQLAATLDELGPVDGPIVVRPSPGRLRAEDEEQ
jgi:uncharacterized protein YecE (DUF72 family)